MNRWHLLASGLLAVLLATGPGVARDLHVAPGGDDRADGLTAATAVRHLAKALALAQAGDTVHLAPAVYRESAVFHNRRGEPGRPIILDGHGATLDGSDALPEAAWTTAGPGRYRTTALPTADNVVMRWYLLFAGRPVHMGRTSKGPRAPFKQPAELQPGEWTFVKAEGAYYVSLAPDQTPATARITAPLRANGVGFTGDCRYLTIRNLTATHVWNDGYNIHGVSREVRFENVRAIECGDDGLSAHEDCEVAVDGLFVSGCSTGICNIGASRSANQRVFIRDCFGFDYYMVETGTHHLADSVIYSTTASGVVSTGPKSGAERLRATFEHVLVQRRRPGAAFAVTGQAQVAARWVTLDGLPLSASAGELTWRDCVLRGQPAPELFLATGVRFTAAHNAYQVSRFRLGQQSFAPAQWADFQRATGQDDESRLLGDGVPAGCGADPARLPAH